MSGETSQLLQQIRVLDPITKSDRICDVLIDSDRNLKIETKITDFPSNTEIIGCHGLVLGSGLVDLYSHSSEPGHEERETLDSLAHSAFAGGFTQIGILPHTIPRLDNKEILTSLIQKTTQFNHLTQFNFWSAITDGGSTPKMKELYELSLYNMGFCDRFNFSSLPLLRQVLEYLKPIKKPIALSLSSNEMTGQGVIREGIQSIRYGLVSNPSYSETSAIAAVIEMVDKIRTPVHIMDISTAGGVRLIADAKNRGIPITASTTWMHLIFDTSDIANYDPNLRLEPPLGNPEDVEVLRDGVREGVVDAIAVNHQAYTYEEKTVPFALAPPGAIGLELVLPILWSKFVGTKKWSALELWKALSTNPQICMGRNPTSLEDKKLKDIILFDPQQTWTVNSKNIHSLSRNTPWWGKEISGRIVNKLNKFN